MVRSFQQTNTFRTASVAQNLARAHRFSRNERDDDIGMSDLLQEFGLAAHVDEPSDKLPYGLQKMLGLLMAFARAQNTCCSMNRRPGSNAASGATSID